MTEEELFKIGKQDNPITYGVRGRMGDFVFRQLNGVTVCSRRPRRPVSRTAAQRTGSMRFRKAAAFAKQQMLNADTRAVYQEMARQHRLPNAYTAAIKTYMNRPETIVKPAEEIADERSVYNVLPRRTVNMHKITSQLRPAVSIGRIVVKRLSSSPVVSKDVRAGPHEKRRQKKPHHSRCGHIQSVISDYP